MRADAIICVVLVALASFATPTSAVRSEDWCVSPLTASLTFTNGSKGSGHWNSYYVQKLLRGKTINVGVIWDPGVAYEKTEPEHLPGYATDPSPYVICTGSDCAQWLDGQDYAVFTEVARRGGFDVNWTLFRGPINDESYNDMVTNITLNYDLSAQWWTDSFARREMGIASGRYFQDLSRELVVPRINLSKKLDPLRLMLKPFSWHAWLAFLGLTTFHAACYFYLEYETFKAEIPNIYEGLMTSWWLSWERFTSGLDAEPRSAQAKLLQMIWGMCTLCFTALYTASLAALIIEVSASNSAINSMSDLQTQGGRAIIFEDDPLRGQLGITYPWLTMVEVPLDNILALSDIKAFLLNYGAQAVIVPHTYAFEIEQSKSSCGAVRSASALSSGGGFVAHYSGCAENILWILDTIMMEMEFDGKTEQLKLQYNPMKCASEIIEVSYTLDITQTYGICLIGGVIMLVVLLLSTLQKTHVKKRRRRLENIVREELNAVLAEMAPSATLPRKVPETTQDDEEQYEEAQAPSRHSSLTRRGFSFGRNAERDL